MEVLTYAFALFLIFAGILSADPLLIFIATAIIAVVAINAYLDSRRMS